MTTRHEVCTVQELPPGERVIVEVDGLSVGVFNLDGEFYALNNTCPHQLANLCEGRITGYVTSDEVGEYEWTRDGQIIQCPWHHWEFDITTGESVFNPHEVRTRTYDVAVESRSGAGGGVTSGEEGSADDDREDGGREDDGPAERTHEDAQVETYGTALRGEEPPIETYPVAVEEDVVVLYV
jgi:nitrite reductase/ring-hydroxylating ferredoxin subunit